MDELLKSYINSKKIQKEFNLDDFGNLEYLFKILSSTRIKCEIIPIYSTDIYPEGFIFQEKKYIIYDISYSLYISHLLNNINALKYFLSIEDYVSSIQVVRNIKSDVYHFIGVKNYKNIQLSSFCLRESHKLYQAINIGLVQEEYALFGEDPEFFSQTINLFMIFHEKLHLHYNHKDNDDRKDLLRSSIYSAINSLKYRTIVSRYQNIEIIENEVIIDVLEVMLKNNDKSKLFEELFCDFFAFIEITMLLTENREFESKELKFDFFQMLSELLRMFDFMNDFFRYSVIKIDKKSDINVMIRHSISNHLRLDFLINYFSENDFKIEELKLYIKKRNYKKTDDFQNIFLQYIFPITAGIQSNIDSEFNNSDMPETQARSIRDFILGKSGNWNAFL